MISEIGAKVGGDRFCDLDRCKRGAALSNRRPRERRRRNLTGAFAVEHRLDLAVARHARGKADPTRAFARAQQRPDQRENARGLDEQPGRAVRQIFPVQFG